MNARSHLTVALLQMEANLVALQVMAEHVLKEANAVIADYRAYIAHMKQEAKSC
jgi:hypothetical protein